jgi:hypothetical protein
MNAKKIAAPVVVVGLLAAGIVASMQASGSSPLRGAADTSTFVTTTAVYDPNVQVAGPCAITTPPSVDPCLAAQGTLRYSFWSSLVNATIFNTWRSQNPGEWTRLQAHMAAPACSSGGVGQIQDMKTALGAALYSEVQAYNCALGTEPITLPAPNPPRLPGAKDKTPPSAPGPITAQTQPLTTTTP